MQNRIATWPDGGIGLGVAATIFVGMVEAPIIITPYVRSMSRSELFTLMSSGMATISGTVLVRQTWKELLHPQTASVSPQTRSKTTNAPHTGTNPACGASILS